MKEIFSIKKKKKKTNQLDWLPIRLNLTNYLNEYNK